MSMAECVRALERNFCYVNSEQRSQQDSTKKLNSSATIQDRPCCAQGGCLVCCESWRCEVVKRALKPKTRSNQQTISFTMVQWPSEREFAIRAKHFFKRRCHCGILRIELGSLQLSTCRLSTSNLLRGDTRVEPQCTLWRANLGDCISRHVA